MGEPKKKEGYQLEMENNTQRSVAQFVTELQGLKAKRGGMSPPVLWQVTKTRLIVTTR